MKILFLTTRFPLPPIKGDKVRNLQLLRYVSREHDIDLISFISKEERRYIDDLRPYCRNIETVTHSKIEGVVRILWNFFSAKPFQVSYYESSEMKKKIRRRLDESSYDVVVVSLLRMIGNLPGDINPPLFGDFGDSMILNFERRLEKEKFLLKLIVWEEVRRLKKFERKVCQNLDKVALVSEKDARNIGSPNCVVIPTGVNTDVFRPDKSLREDLKIIFTGNMGYFPNIDAVLYFTREIFPSIRREIPNVKFEIAGVNPSPKIKKLYDTPHVNIVGYVESMPDFINTGTVYVAPIRCGSGVQNKVLEAMACGVPVVLTYMACAGIKAEPGRDFLLADSKNEFVENTVKLLKDPEARENLSKNALEFIKKNYTWEATGGMFEQSIRDLEK